MPTLLRCACLAALTLAVALAGCGGDDVEASNAYVDAVNTAQNDFARTFDTLQTQITAQSSAAQDRKTLEQFGDAIDAVVRDLKAVETPAKVQSLHDQLIDAIAGYGKTIASARKAFASDDPAEVLAARTQLSTDVAATSSRINRTIDAINRKLRE
ncbi:hypothetical protein [Paraconexibacter sp.]|uniref:hypothetical protein n=1 Tax=Paraconexibacter sp. TaxID=2949640 RepID=UPI003568CB27